MVVGSGTARGGGEVAKVERTRKEKFCSPWPLIG